MPSTTEYGAIDRLTLCEEIIKNHNGGLTGKGEASALAQLMVLQDEITFGHAQRLVHLAKGIAQELNFTGDALIEVCDAARYHDLGKIKVPIEILNKPGRLTSEEFEIIKHHSVDGANMVLDISPDWINIADGIRTHHERIDGSGYPDGLRGDDIPILGRIIAIADVYDALTHRRPYRESSYDDTYAMTFIKDHSGLHFDPVVVSAFVATQVSA